MLEELRCSLSADNKIQKRNLVKSLPWEGGGWWRALVDHVCVCTCGSEWQILHALAKQGWRGLSEWALAGESCRWVLASQGPSPEVLQLLDGACHWKTYPGGCWQAPWLVSWACATNGWDQAGTVDGLADRRVLTSGWLHPTGQDSPVLSRSGSQESLKLLTGSWQTLGNGYLWLCSTEAVPMPNPVGFMLAGVLCLSAFWKVLTDSSNVHVSLWVSYS